MALWQFDVTFVRAGRDVRRRLDGSFELEGLPLADLFCSMGFLHQLGFESWQMTDSWTAFGNEDGNRVDLLRVGDTQCEISARIDALDDSDIFPEVVCELAKELKCDLLVADAGCVISPSKEAVVSALTRSDAWRFALDPQRYLSGPI